MIAAIRPLSSFFGAVDNQTRGCAGIQCGHWKSPHSIHWILVYHHFPVKQMVTEFCPFLVSSEVWRLCGAVVDDRSHQASWEHGCDMNGSKAFKLPVFLMCCFYDHLNLVRRFQARFGGSEAAASLLCPFWNISLKRLVSTCSKHQMLVEASHPWMCPSQESQMLQFPSGKLSCPLKLPGRLLSCAVALKFDGVIVNRECAPAEGKSEVCLLGSCHMFGMLEHSPEMRLDTRSNPKLGIQHHIACHIIHEWILLDLRIQVSLHHVQ